MRSAGSCPSGGQGHVWEVCLLSGSCLFRKTLRDFPGGPVVKTSLSNAGGAGSIPGQGAKIPHASGPKKPKNIKQKQYCNKFNKDFKNGPHQKKKSLKKKKTLSSLSANG